MAPWTHSQAPHDRVTCANLTVMQEILFVLGAGDPEMVAIRQLLAAEEVPWVQARVRGKRVYPANAYRAALPQEADAALARGAAVYCVECVGALPPGVHRIDHHHPGDPGYGRPPVEFWAASSLGQTVQVLTAALGHAIAVTPEMRLTAASDHCLGAAYRGACPGIAPDDLMHWHVAARARYEQRPVTALLADVAATRAALRSAPRVTLAPGVRVADMRELPDAELLIAAPREGQCCLSALTARDGRTKIGCLVGSPEQIRAFMQQWAPAHGLVDIYGDPVRGFAGAYVPQA